MRRIWYSPGYQILHVGRILHVNSASQAQKPPAGAIAGSPAGPRARGPGRPRGPAALQCESTLK